MGEILKAQESESKLIAAICAAPNVLKAHGIAKGKKITSYPSVKNDLTSDYSYIDDQIVVTDGNFYTFLSQESSSILMALQYLNL